MNCKRYKKSVSIIALICSLSSCSIFTNYKTTSKSGGVNVGSPKKALQKNLQRAEKRQAKHYNRALKKRAKRLGTTKKR